MPLLGTHSKGMCEKEQTTLMQGKRCPFFTIVQANHILSELRSHGELRYRLPVVPFVSAREL